MEEYSGFFAIAAGEAIYAEQVYQYRARRHRLSGKQ